MDEGKTREIFQWPAPRNVSEVHTFMGLCGYYRRYVKDFAQHAAPLHALTKIDVGFDWDQRQQTSFNHFKWALISAPILGMSQDEGMFVLDDDASNLAVGAVLQQTQGEVLHIIGYASRTFNACEPYLNSASLNVRTVSLQLD